MHDPSALDAQALLLSLGSVPINPVLPGQASADEVDRCMLITSGTPEYAALSARRLSGEIDGAAFETGLMDLIRQLRERGAFATSTDT